jgi:hypothetical protein
MPWEDPNCGCGHPWEEHNITVGCLADWEYDHEGIATTGGCECKLAHVERSNDDIR